MRLIERHRSQTLEGLSVSKAVGEPLASVGVAEEHGATKSLLSDATFSFTQWPTFSFSDVPYLLLRSDSNDFTSEMLEFGNRYNANTTDSNK